MITNVENVDANEHLYVEVTETVCEIRTNPRLQPKSMLESVQRIPVSNEQPYGSRMKEDVLVHNKESLSDHDLNQPVAPKGDNQSDFSPMREMSVKDNLLKLSIDRDFETTRTIDITGDTGPDVSSAIAKEKNAQIPLGIVEKLIFISSNISTSTSIQARDLFSIFNSRVPDTLIRSLEPEFFFGLHSYDGNNAVLIFNVDSFDQAYAGMLKWEPNIQDDIGSMFGVAGTKIAATSAEIPKWQDRVIGNKDTRSLIDQNGNILMFYSFIDNKTLVFTSNQDTFKEII